jgi:hypothetical protein
MAQEIGPKLFPHVLLFQYRTERMSNRMRTSCGCRKLNPAILVVQSAQDWATKNVSGALDGARDWRIFLQG